jgi:hypothetical protein
MTQERLNDGLENLRDVLTNDSNPFKPKNPSDFFSVRANFLIEILDEIKRLQAIEESLTKGKSSVKNIYDFYENHDGPAIYSGQTVSSIIYDVLNHLNITIKGVNDHE